MKPSFIPKSIVLFFTTAILFHQQVFSQTSIFGYTTNWHYLNTATNPSLPTGASGWTSIAYAETGWNTAGGNAQFHVAESGATSLGAAPANNTIYFRKTFNLTTPSATYSTFDLTLVRDDGAIVYVNGTEVYRSNIAAGAVTYATTATSNVNGGPEGDEYVINVPASSFVNGSNTIAVEVHQNNTNDMRFQLKMDGNLIPTPTINRGPYIQVVNETEATLRWRTDIASDSRVQIGTSQGVYTIVTDDASSVTQHIVRVTGLSPDTKYFYSVGSTSNPTLGGHATDYYFRTAPSVTTTRKMSFAVFGDCGRNDNNFRTNTIAAYNSYVGTNKADALLLLGDNAYTNGTEAEYNTGFFTPMSSTMLKNHPVFPAPGNHDYYGTSQASRSGEYYQSFSMPTAAECGGLASGTKAYYSWNWGDVHFLSLDSYGTETGSALRLYDTTGPQVTWIKNDLAANTRKWVVAYWHHAPYTLGSHNSSSETELVEIRSKFIRILERMGVDLILCGHSHSYERSKLLNGHYGTEVSAAAMAPYIVDNSSARYEGSTSCPYKTVSGTQNHGTVYVVAGSSGADGTPQSGLDGWPHNALPYYEDNGGMLYLEIEGNRLDAKFILQSGGVTDKFTILKDVNKTTNYSIVNGQSQTLTASWPGTHSWVSPANTTKSVTVTPPSNSITNYTVTDGMGCLTDQFSITTTGTLPVTLTNYAAYLRQDQVHVQWTTATEINNDHFIIERSADARQFVNIGRVNGAGNSTSDISYEFIDPSPLEGVSFYRLSEVATDGAVKLYDIKKINNNKTSNFYADAYKSGTEAITMQVYSNKAEKIQLRVVDMNGRTIRSEDWSLTAGSNNKTIALKNGTYILQWKRRDGNAVTQKIVVQ